MPDQKPPFWQRLRLKVGSSSTNASARQDEDDVEIDQYGPQVLSEPTNTDDPAVDIVFVHGLRGNRIETWSKKTKDSKVCWPRDFLGEDLKNSRVITWGYDADVARLLSKASQGSLTGHAQSLLMDVSAISDGKRPVIWVGHSLGGLVIKQAIILAAGYTAHQRHPEQGKLYDATIGCVFLGTPHRGSDQEGLGQVIANIARASFLRPNKQLLATLARDSHILETQRDQFTTVSEKIPISCFYESNPMSIGMIVPQHSAVYDGFQVQSQSIPGDHREMARFENRQAAGYIRVRQQLLRMLQIHRDHTTQVDSATKKSLTKVVKNCLRFDGMNDRMYRVDNAHEHTFEWALVCEVGDETHSRHRHKSDDSTPHATKSLPSFVEWLEGDHQSLFWLSGKAGSGKSTLMKWIYDQPETRLRLEAWAAGRPLYKCQFFMHDRGEFMQKSREGMLRCILHQILEADQDLANVAFPHVFEQHADEPTESVDTMLRDHLHWQALLDAFMNVVHHIINSSGKICIFIDALDEYRNAAREKEYTEEDLDLLCDGDDGDEGQGPGTPISTDQYDIAQLCLRLGKIRGLKICVSSRELTVFERNFDAQPRIRLQECNKADIQRYVSDRLNYNSPAWVKNKENIVWQVVTKSCGVFLWTRLIVDLLWDDLINMGGDDLTKLQRTIDSAPPRLLGSQGLYMMMMKNVRKDHLLESSRIFRLVRCFYSLPADIALYALESWEPVPYGRHVVPKKPAWLGERLDDKPDLEKFGQMAKSRCAGLLECEPPSYSVDFMHQTAREFISRPSVWVQIYGRIPDTELDVKLAMLSGYITKLKKMEHDFVGMSDEDVQSYQGLMLRRVGRENRKFARLAAEADGELLRSESDGATYIELIREFDRTMSVLHDMCHHTTAHETGEPLPHGTGGHYWTNCPPFSRTWPEGVEDFLTQAMFLGLATYVKAGLLQLDEPRSQTGKPQLLLDSFLWLGRLVNGYNPRRTNLTSYFEDAGNLTYLGDIRQIQFVRADGKLEALRIILHFGANPNRIWDIFVRKGYKAFENWHHEDPLSRFHGLEAELWVEALGIFLDFGVDTVKPVQLEPAGENKLGRTVTFPTILQELLGGREEFEPMIPELLVRAARGRDHVKCGQTRTGSLGQRHRNFY